VSSFDWKARFEGCQQQNLSNRLMKSRIEKREGNKTSFSLESKVRISLYKTAKIRPLIWFFRRITHSDRVGIYT